MLRGVGSDRDRQQATADCNMSTIGPQFVRELGRTVETAEGADGRADPHGRTYSGGIILDAVDHARNYTWPVNGQTYPRIQVVTVADLLHGIRPNMPPLMLPYIQAAKALPRRCK
jgi:hypothetical protein